jgi:DsbC/DsbD-like thiol-disulfide interchange protein
MAFTGGVSTPGLGYVRLALEPGWKTYAPDPGPWGVAPSFTVASSDNVAGWHVVWPPAIPLSSYGQAFLGYDHSVEVEIHVRAWDATRPMRLELDVFAASCAQVCVPLEGRVALVFPQTGGAG